MPVKGAAASFCPTSHLQPDPLPSSGGARGFTDPLLALRWNTSDALCSLCVCAMEWRR